MTDTKTPSVPKAATKKGAQKGAALPAGRQPSSEARRPGPAHKGAVDDAINKALRGRVNVSPIKAVEMAGKLYNRGQLPEAARVCQQIIDSRPGLPDAHNKPEVRAR